MLNISFDFDELTHKVSNVKVSEKIEKSIPEIEVIGDYDLQILDNKIQLTSEAVVKLNAAVKDRIAINYWYVEPNVAFPVISKAEIFDNGTDGLLLTKNKTLMFRGEQRDTLLRFGTVFVFEELKDKNGEIKKGVFKLIPINKEDDSLLEKEIVDTEKTAVEQMDLKELEDDAEWLMSL